MTESYLYCGNCEEDVNFTIEEIGLDDEGNSVFVNVCDKCERIIKKELN